MLDTHRARLPLDPFRELHHPERHGRDGVSRRRWPARARDGRARCGCSTTPSARSPPRASSGATSGTAGVEVRAFHPLRPLSLVTNFSRNHRKLVVADGAPARSSGGSASAASGPAKPSKAIQPWRDTAVDIGGPAAAVLDQAFARTWEVAGGTAARRRCRRHGSRRRGSAEVRVIGGEPGRERAYRVIELLAAGQHRAALDHRRVPGGPAAAVPGAARRGPRRRGRAAAGARLERPAARPQSLPHRLPRSAAERRADLRVGRPDAARQDHRVRRSLGPDRLQQPQPVQPARELRARRADRGPALAEAMERQFRLDIGRSREVHRRPVRGPAGSARRSPPR